MYSSANVMLGKQTIVTDYSVVPIKDEHESVYTLYSSGEDKISYSIGNYSTYCAIYFLRSSFSGSIKR